MSFAGFAGGDVGVCAPEHRGQVVDGKEREDPERADLQNLTSGRVPAEPTKPRPQRWLPDHEPTHARREREARELERAIAERYAELVRGGHRIVIASFSPAAPLTRWMVVLFDLGSPPRPRLTIERGSYTKAVVRCFFDDDNGRRSCLDSRLMSRSAAVKLAKRIAKDGTEVEVLGWRFNMIRPAPYMVRRTKRLDAVRLNKVPALISAASMFADSPVLMEHDDEQRDADGEP